MSILKILIMIIIMTRFSTRHQHRNEKWIALNNGLDLVLAIIIITVILRARARR